MIMELYMRIGYYFLRIVFDGVLPGFSYLRIMSAGIERQGNPISTFNNITFNRVQSTTILCPNVNFGSIPLIT